MVNGSIRRTPCGRFTPKGTWTRISLPLRPKPLLQFFGGKRGESCTISLCILPQRPLERTSKVVYRATGLKKNTFGPHGCKRPAPQKQRRWHNTFQPHIYVYFDLITFWYVSVFFFKIANKCLVIGAHLTEFKKQTNQINLNISTNKVQNHYTPHHVF